MICPVALKSTFFLVLLKKKVPHHHLPVSRSHGLLSVASPSAPLSSLLSLSGLISHSHTLTRTSSSLRVLCNRPPSAVIGRRAGTGQGIPAPERIHPKLNPALRPLPARPHSIRQRTPTFFLPPRSSSNPNRSAIDRPTISSQFLQFSYRQPSIPCGVRPSLAQRRTRLFGGSPAFAIRRAYPPGSYT